MTDFLWNLGRNNTDFLGASNKHIHIVHVSSTTRPEWTLEESIGASPTRWMDSCTFGLWQRFVSHLSRENSRQWKMSRRVSSRKSLLLFKLWQSSVGLWNASVIFVISALKLVHCRYVRCYTYTSACKLEFTVTERRQCFVKNALKCWNKRSSESG